MQCMRVMVLPLQALQLLLKRSVGGPESANISTQSVTTLYTANQT